MRRVIIQSILASGIAIITTSLSLCVFAHGHMTWKINNDASSINYLSTKVFKGDTRSSTESNTFKTIAGYIEKSGAFNIEIDLKSVETNIPIRNERMQKYVFQTDTNPIATITGNLPAQALKSGNKRLSLDIQVNIHGISKKMKTKVMVVREGKRLLVTTVEPILVNASDFNITDGLKKLTELASLFFITTQVPVTLNLQFQGK